MAHLSEISKSIKDMNEDEARDFIRAVRLRRTTIIPRKTKKVTKFSVNHLAEKVSDFEADIMIARLEESLALSEGDRKRKSQTSNAGSEGIQ